MTVPFRFHVPIVAFTKALPDGRKSRRFGGMVTTPTRDKQEERVFTEGLDFSDFHNEGWFNDNHGKSTTDVVGLPAAAVKPVKKGQELPNGMRAKADGFWAEGVAIGTKGREIFRIAKDLEGTGRSLGFSIEGNVLQRDPLDPRDILRAKVRNIAVTHCPVNPETELVVLTKALSAGSAIANPGASPGQGFPLRTESLDREVKYLEYGPGGVIGGKRRRKRKKNEPLSEQEGIAVLKSLDPGLSEEGARNFYQYVRRLKALGVL